MPEDRGARYLAHFRRRLPLYLCVFAVPACVSVFFVGFRFDDYWGVS